FLSGKYLEGIPEGSRLSFETFGWLRNRWLQDVKIEKLRKLMALAQELGVSMASLAIAWTLANPNVTTTILGATREEQLNENLKSLDVVNLLTGDVMERIESILGNKPVMDLS
ncbi:MAG TPA: aldo/keto reductase, partial [Chitinophagaceae bacterium]|nr:aldo/keto reductase [Chitinophagaceae bacterium]